MTGPKNTDRPVDTHQPYHHEELGYTTVMGALLHRIAQCRDYVARPLIPVD